MQFLFLKPALCWESYDKIQNSFQLLFVLTWDYSLSLRLLQTPTCYRLKTTGGQIALGPLKGRGAFLPSMEWVTYSLGGFSSMISFCRVLPLILFIPHIRPFSHQDTAQIIAIQWGVWFFFKLLLSPSAGVQLLREAKEGLSFLWPPWGSVLKGHG